MTETPKTLTTYENELSKLQAALSDLHPSEPNQAEYSSANRNQGKSADDQASVKLAAILLQVYEAIYSGKRGFDEPCSQICSAYQRFCNSMPIQPQTNPHQLFRNQSDVKIVTDHIIQLSKLGGDVIDNFFEANKAFIMSDLNDKKFSSVSKKTLLEIAELAVALEKMGAEERVRLAEKLGLIDGTKLTHTARLTGVSADNSLTTVQLIEAASTGNKLSQLAKAIDELNTNLTIRRQ